MAESVTIIVLNWNRPEDTLACVASLRAMRGPAFDLLLVDNGSTDQSAARLRAALPDVPLIANATNLGFAEGNNVGIRQALAHGAAHVLLLNNDTVVDPGMLEGLLAAAKAHPRAGFLGAKIFYHAAPERIWMGRPDWDPQTCRFTHAGLNAPDASAGLDTVAPAAYACGCAMLVRAETIAQIGLMDPRFFCYYEEVDWCFRGARQNWHSLYVPAAKVWHKVSASSAGGKQSPVVRYFRTRNSLLWASRNLAPAQRRRVFRNMAAETFDGLGWQEQGAAARMQRAYWNLLTIQRDPLMRAWRRGVLDYLLGRFGDAPPAVKRL